MNIFELIKVFYGWAEANPDKVKPYHWAIYMVAVEKCNQFGWKEKFGLPTFHLMELTGIGSRKTYYKGLSDLGEFGFIEIVSKSVNQSTSTIIQLCQPEDSRSTSAVQTKINQKTGIRHIERHLKTNKDFETNKNNKEFLKFLLLQNSDLSNFLFRKNEFPESEIGNINAFLNEKLSANENNLWKNEVDFFRHFRNWLLKKKKDTEKKEILKKAERRQ